MVAEREERKKRREKREERKRPLTEARRFKKGPREIRFSFRHYWH